MPSSRREDSGYRTRRIGREPRAHLLDERAVITGSHIEILVSHNHAGGIDEQQKVVMLSDKCSGGCLAESGPDETRCGVSHIGAGGIPRGIVEIQGIHGS